MKPEEKKFDNQYSNSYKKLCTTTLFHWQHNILLTSKYKHKCHLTYKYLSRYLANGMQTESFMCTQIIVHRIY